MRAVWPLFTALVLAVPQSVIAANTAISCALTKEDLFFVSKKSPDGASVQRDIAGTATFTLTDSALLTSMDPPCDRLAHTNTGASIDATCSFPTGKDSPASIRIQIDRRLGAISETWDIIESDGSKFHYLVNGNCSNSPSS